MDGFELKCLNLIVCFLLVFSSIFSAPRAGRRLKVEIAPTVVLVKMHVGWHMVCTLCVEDVKRGI
jgi:hypothetical protein